MIQIKILDFGSLNYDYVYGVEHMVAPGETISSLDMEIFCGGKGFMAGMVGKDGQLFMDICKENGIDSSFIRQVPGKSGHAIIQLDQNGQNSILLYGGSNRQMTKEYVDEVLNNFEKGDLLLLQNEINLLSYIIDKAYEKGMRILLNPSPYDEKLAACDLTKVSVFLINEIEGEQEPDKILDALTEKYPEAEIMLTLGSKGSVYCRMGERYKQDIYKVKAVDTTAAGDTFTGYFAASLLKGMPIEETLKKCAKASAVAVSRKGAADSIPREEEVDGYELL